MLYLLAVLTGFAVLAIFTDGGGGEGGEGQNPEGGEGGKKQEEPFLRVKVDGTDRVFTKEEAAEACSMLSASNSRMEQASHLRDEGVEGIRIKTLMADLSSMAVTPGQQVPAAVINKARELGSLLGLNEEQVNTVMELYSADLSASGLNQPVGDQQGNSTPKYVEESQLSPELRAELKEGREMRAALMNQSLTKKIENIVDNDEFFKQYLSGRAVEVKPAVYGAVQREVERLAAYGERVGPELISKALQTVRGNVEVFGKPSSGDGQPGTGLGPSGGQAAAFKGVNPPERVPVSDPGWRKNMADRLKHYFYNVK